MDVGPPQHPQDKSPRRSRPRRAAWCAGAGVILAIADVISSTMRAVSVQQAIAMGLPAALLIIGGLIAAALPNAANGRRLSYQAGFRAGSLLTRLRSVFRQPRPLSRGHPRCQPARFEQHRRGPHRSPRATAG